MSRMGRISEAERQFLLLKKLRRRLRSRDSARVIFSTRDLARRLEDAKRRCTGDWLYPPGNPPGWDESMNPRDTSIAQKLRSAKLRFRMFCDAGMGPKPVLPSGQAEPPQSEV